MNLDFYQPEIVENQQDYKKVGKTKTFKLQQSAEYRL
jgi:hypothetical protein